MEHTTVIVPARKTGDFWIFWTGQTISRIGSTLTNFALPLLIFNLTGSALNVGLTMAATYLPYVLFSLVSGVWVDRVNRKVLMISLDIARALLLGLVPLLVLFAHFSVWWIYLITFVNALLTMIFSTASYAAVAHLVKPGDLVKANGQVQTGVYGAAIVGPLLATVILTRWSIQLVLWCDALTFLISAGSLALVRTRFNGTPARAQEQESFGQAIIEGVRYVFSQPILYMLGLIALLVNIAIAPIGAQIIVFAAQVFGATNAQIGTFATALGVGGVIATLVVGPLKRHLPYGVLLLGSLLLSGVLTIVFVFVRNYWAALVLWGGIFGMTAIFNVIFFSLLQALPPDHMRGRAILSAQLLAALVIPLADILSGMVIDQVKNVALVYGVLGVFYVISTLAFLRSPLAHVERYLPASQSISDPLPITLEEPSVVNPQPTPSQERF